MSSRTTRSFVTFIHPFVLDEEKGALPAGTYEVIAQDELLQSPSFVAYRRTSSQILVKWPESPGKIQLLPIDPRDLERVLAQDRAFSKTHQNSEAALSPSKDQK